MKLTKLNNLNIKKISCRNDKYIKVIRLQSSLNSKRLFSFNVRHTLKTEVNYCVNKNAV